MSPPHSLLRPALAPRDVHVWTIDLTAHAAREAELRALLQPDELEHAASFHFPVDRTRYAVSHGILREVLASYLVREPTTLRFNVGRWGKPALTAASNDADPITFNLSHSGELMLLAVARSRRVGVDIERWAGEIEYDELAAHHFSAAERAVLASMVGERKQRGFFACWSRKEAYLKALGFGISRGLAHFDVTLAPDQPARLIADRLPGADPTAWTMVDLGAAYGYSAALVAEGRDWILEQLTLP